MTALEKIDEERLLSGLEALSVSIGKNEPGDFANKWDRAMFFIVIELVERAMGEGDVTFKQVVNYVRAFIWDSTLDDTANELDIDMLQGAYIAISGRYKVKGVTPKSEVVAVESVEELIDEEDDWEAEDLAEMEVEYQKWARPLSRCYMELGSIPSECHPDQGGTSAPGTDAAGSERPT